jgi:glutamyl/glutaminyl-tRNA synthetase
MNSARLRLAARAARAALATFVDRELAMPAPTPEHGRFAPTTSGPAHPGTLLAGLLAWLDARRLGARFSLRLEDVDLGRCRPEHAQDMLAALEWLGLDWDACSLQSEHQAAFEAALDRLAEAELLYPCACSRAEVQRAGQRAVDGSWRYPGTCRARALSPGGWRGCKDALRLRLAPGRVAPRDEGGLDLAQDPSLALGDPVLRRRDGAVAYHLAVVVDDAAQAVTRVVRGRDLAACTALQVVLQGALALPTPSYRHHLLLLEPRGEKLAKLHGAVGWRELRERYTAQALTGWLAQRAGLQESAAPLPARELLAGFAWDRVRREDAVVSWTGQALEALP